MLAPITLRHLRLHQNRQPEEDVEERIASEVYVAPVVSAVAWMPWTRELGTLEQKVVASVLDRGRRVVEYIGRSSAITDW